ncbi:MAG: glycosyltransferase [Planctomycetota bacterium]
MITARGSGLDPTLESNLVALRERDEELVRRLLLPVRGDHVIVGGPNPSLYRSHHTLEEFTVSSQDLEASVADVQDGDDVFLFGVSLGEQLAHLLRTRPACKITVWDRDPWLFRLTLQKQDYRNSLRFGRVRLALGADLVGLFEGLPGRRVVVHPFFRHQYSDELALVEAAAQGRPPRGPWTALGMGGFVVAEVGEALRAEGHQTFPFEVQRWAPGETALALRRLRPQRLVMVNYSREVAEVCEAERVPLVVWEIDPSTDRTAEVVGNGQNVRLFTYREKHVELYRSAGFPNVAHLPPGSDTLKRHPVELSDEQRAWFGSDVCFVGSSMAGHARKYRRLFLQLHASFDSMGVESFEQTEARLDEVLSLERQDYSQSRIIELVEERFAEFLAAARKSRTRDDPVKWVAEIAASEKRMHYVNTLGRFGIRVWGDREWERIDTLGGGARYLGTAGHAAELTLVYNGAKIHVDINRSYQTDVIPIRVFDVLACGGFLIAEHSAELAELFKIGAELEAYHTLDELEQKVEYYLAHPDEARAIAARGLAAVRERHTVRHRVRELLG